MAMGGAVVAAVATMFIPAAVLEGITGSTGLSELFPAAAAPLGDTARALIAFCAGVFTLAILAFVLLRQDGAPTRTPIADPYATAPLDDAVSLKDRLARIKLPQISMPKMPWVKGEDDITDLADLPKLKNGDIHPDAPARRPLSATQDLPVLDLAEVVVELPEVATPVEAGVAPVPAATPFVEAASTYTAAPAVALDTQPSLAEMVAQLEAAVTERQKQLAELEVVAAQLAAKRPSMSEAPVETAAVEHVEIIPDSAISIEPARAERPPLEAVPASPVKEDEMDSALAAALATLHRMNGTGR
jgi:hypothetical protein